MSAGYQTKLEVPPDTRPSALLRSGIRRGAVLVFLPVFVAGQAIAWLTYAVSGWYRPWSWFKIGIAETLASVRVTFTASSPDGPGTLFTRGQPQSPAVLEVAVGALTVAVVVLAYRAGREQAHGLEDRPGVAALAGASTALGFALPMLVLAPLVTLGFPQFGIEHLEPVLWQAFVLPFVVAGGCGAVGALASAHEALEERGPWGARLIEVARGGFTAFWWGLALAFAAFLVLAALGSGATGAYARFVDRSGGSGAALVVQHALLLPNQSATVLATTMGVPTTLAVGDTTAVRITMGGIHTIGDLGGGLAALVHAPSTRAEFPAWYLVFLAVPAAATLIGGRTAGRGGPGPRGGRPPPRRPPHGGARREGPAGGRPPRRAHRRGVRGALRDRRVGRRRRPPAMVGARRRIASAQRGSARHSPGRPRLGRDRRNDRVARPRVVGRLEGPERAVSDPRSGSASATRRPR